MNTPRCILLTRYLASAAQADSGIGRHIRTLADALSDAGRKPEIILFTEQEKAQRAARDASPASWNCTIQNSRSYLPDFVSRRINWPLRILIDDLVTALRAIPALFTAGAGDRDAVVETHSTGFPSLFTALFGLPVIVRVSTTMTQLNNQRGVQSRWLDLGARIERLHLASAAALVTHSRRHRDTVAMETGLPARRFALIPHGIPPAPPGPSRQTAPTAPRILFVGRFERRKGVDILVAALPGLLARHPSLEVALVGDHTGWCPAAELAGFSSDERKRISLPGKIDEDALSEEWSRASIFVAPSRYESFGLMYVEAMAHGVPPIGCFVGGVPDVITDGHDGLLVPAENPRALESALDRLLTDEAFRQRLAANALESYRERFSSKQMASTSLALYESFLSFRSGVVV